MEKRKNVMSTFARSQERILAGHSLLGSADGYSTRYDSFQIAPPAKEKDTRVEK
jgi:hypothetical protein